MNDVYIFGAVLAFILLDVASGFIAALKNNEVSSSVMREGLFKKCGSIMLMIGAVIVEHIGIYVGIDNSITTAIMFGIGGLLVVMEVTSFIENVCKVNPDLPINKIFAMFGIDDNTDDIATFPSFECPYIEKVAVYNTKDDSDVCVSD